MRGCLCRLRVLCRGAPGVSILSQLLLSLSGRPMLWIALYLPRLPLDLAYRRWPEPMRESLEHGVPLAVTEAERIRWANACAQDAGVNYGMQESSARSRAAELVLLARDLDLEARAIVEAALWALHFTPQV